MGRTTSPDKENTNLTITNPSRTAANGRGEAKNSNTMKLFYKKITVAIAVLALVATNAVADRYHAQSVQCRTGISESVTKLELLGVNADSAEIWGSQKYNDDYAYFWCDIDGKSFSVPETNIDGDMEHTLVEIGFWEKMLLRRIPSGYSQTLFVKVRGNQSGDNSFMSYGTPDSIDNSSWLIQGCKVLVNPIGTPTYNAIDDVFTQEIKWSYEKIPNSLIAIVSIQRSYDDGETWWTLRYFNKSEQELHRRAATVTLPGDKEKVRYRIVVTPPEGLNMVVENWEFLSDESKTFELSKQIVSPDSIGGGSGGDLKRDSTATDGSGTDGINATVMKAHRLVNVYDLNGACVSSGVTLDRAAATLRRGIYVVDGKKVTLGK